MGFLFKKKSGGSKVHGTYQNVDGVHAEGRWLSQGHGVLCDFVKLTQYF